MESASSYVLKGSWRLGASIDFEEDWDCCTVLTDAEGATLHEL